MEPYVETWWTQVNSKHTRKTRVLTCVCKTCHSSVLNSLSCHIPYVSVTCFLAGQSLPYLIVTCTQLAHAVELLLLSGFLHIKLACTRLKFNTIHMHICTCMHVYMHLYTCKHIHTHTWTHNIQVYIHSLYIQTWTYTHIPK